VTTVRAECPACGDVQLGIDGLTVRVCDDDHVAATYRFRCPDCESVVNRSASSRIVELLVSAGAHYETWHAPAELSERPGGPPLTHDDLLDLHDLLSDDAWFGQLVALVRHSGPE
jgi:predicted RNA-binding Zn-ribbon protein involved in translation (DUF1610 family)